LEYDREYKSKCAFIRFPITQLSPRLKEISGLDEDNLSLLIWTCTPWTLPGNRAIAIHQDTDYAIVTLVATGAKIIVASSRLDHLEKMMPDVEFDVQRDPIRGLDLVGLMYANPLQKWREQPVIHADFVTSNSGTGLVHLAPNHGIDDYNVCQKCGIIAPSIVDDDGNFTVEAYPEQPELLKQKNIQTDGAEAVLAILRGIN
jgi:isoleucyl-tRNA synthetase